MENEKRIINIENMISKLEGEISELHKNVAVSEKRISNMENKMPKLESEISELHKNTAVSEKEIRMIFDILNEIKDSIKDIAKDLGNLKEKPANRWDSMVTTAIAVIVTAVITHFITTR